ncbi:hypothetical protein SmJEL517_g06000 [Synchytrium microbalum]|uniref:Tyrosine-protein phosphatase domain-containing protein n=1 Tax=Synchytrium microbalum TaxID=1806994 RepID=A0A507BTQ2_9FUNG|nr:uncharacterized protein SmJEL517_g06000 [Synchytrium microbalum]TPX30449.1 hypothetical protein SmJEL517_g06000 [Synchytrium microbalum]
MGQEHSKASTNEVGSSLASGGDTPDSKKSKRFSKASSSSLKTPISERPTHTRLGSLELDSEQALAIQAVTSQRSSDEISANGSVATTNNTTNPTPRFLLGHRRSHSSNTTHKVAPESQTASDKENSLARPPTSTEVEQAPTSNSLATSPILPGNLENSSSLSSIGSIPLNDISAIPAAFQKKNSLASRRSSTASGHNRQTLLTSSRSSSVSASSDSGAAVVASGNSVGGGSTAGGPQLQPPRLDILRTKSSKKASKEALAASIIAANSGLSTAASDDSTKGGLLSNLIPPSTTSTKASGTSAAPMSKGVGSQIPSLVAAIDPTKLPAWLSRLSTLSSKDATKLLTTAYADIEHEERDRITEAVTYNTSHNVAGTGDGGHSHGFWAAGTAANSRRNRYTDILPYDGNRFRLQYATPSLTASGPTTSDYINASLIQPLYSNHMYIATQGPLTNTIGDFWRMIWDSGSRMILMLTTLEERGRPKCARYWPDQIGTALRLAEVGGLDLEYAAELNFTEVLPRLSIKRSSPVLLNQNLQGSTLSATSASSASAFSLSKRRSDASLTAAAASDSGDDLRGFVRVFRLSGRGNDGVLETRRIYQVHFTGWPDHRASSAEAVLRLREVVNIIENEERLAASGKPMNTGSLSALVNWEEVVSVAKQPIVKRFSHRRGASSTSTFEGATAAANYSNGNSLASNSGASSNNITTNSNNNNGAKTSSKISYSTPIGPTVVHCSAGCGRTGTYIAIDSILAGWKEASEYPIVDSTAENPIDPIIETLRKLREQRVSMVQTLEQFALCYEAVLVKLSE